MLKINNLNVEINNKKILNDVSFEVVENDIFMILGPNGSGKTTIIKSIMNDIKYNGNIDLKGNSIKKINLSNISKQIGVLMQKNNLEFDNSVYDIVSLGRYTYNDSLFGKLSEYDENMINEAMKLTDILHLKKRSISNISGGEMQRVFLAIVLAQDPNILILDEPTNHLDLKHQINIFEILKKWSNRENKAIIAIIHDLNFAYKYGNKALLLKNGKVISNDKIKNSLTKDNLKEIYDIDVFEWMKILLENFN